MKIVLRILLLLTVLVSAGPLRAALAPGQVGDDTDLFLFNPLAAASTDLPNVLIVWDTTANSKQTINYPQLNADGTPVLDAKGNPVMLASSAFDLEKTALETVIRNLPTGPGGTARFRVGLMLFTETGGGNSNVRGTYPRYAFQPMDTANKTKLADLIAALHSTNDRGSNAQYAKGMHEAQLYLAGKTPLAGGGQVKKDPLAFKANGDYLSPATGGCQKNFIIMMSNGTTDSGENNESQKLLAGLKGVNPKDPIPLSPSGEQPNWADEYARTMAKTGFFDAAGKETLKAQTYTVAVYDKDKEVKQLAPTMGQIRLAESMAFQGDGKYFAGTDLSSIQKAFEETFILINEVDGVFASTTLPVSVNVRGTQLNQLYMGVFRPDGSLLPRWPGNLKMYKLALQGDNVILADATGQKADDSTSGFINATAISHWTTALTNGANFWDFNPSGVGGGADSPDGPIVEKGAVAQNLRAAYATDHTGRKLLTCTGGCTGGTPLSTSTSETAFTTANANITAALLTPTTVPVTPVISAADRDLLINWIRGEDNKDNEDSDLQADNVTPLKTDARASIHGDVLHSRPAVINYNRNADDNDIYAFYGANDGIFRAIKGAFGTGAGSESWGFIPSEFFDRLKRLRDNSPNDATDPYRVKRPYFADGPIGTYQEDANSDGKLVAGTDKVYLYIGMRRGGRFIYALDVSDPDAPIMLWKKSNTDPGFGELGMTWSEPKIARLLGRTTPVLVMGAGYDPNQDNDPILKADSMGRGIMVLDYLTGEILWQAGFGPSGGTGTNLTVAGMDYSIPSDVTILDRDSDGNIDRIYVGDTGGNLWRVDVHGNNFGKWEVHKLASVSGATADAKRKFLYPPDVVFNPGVAPQFDSVLIGTGDREKPFDVTVENRFYMFKDPDTGLSSAGGLITEADLFDATSNVIQTNAGGGAAAAKADLDKNSKGWLLRFVDTDATTGAQTLRVGEKVISGSVTVGGTTFFNTNQPGTTSTTQCTTLGTARQYAVNFSDATSTIDFTADGTYNTFDRSVAYGQGYLPSPVPVLTPLGPDGELKLVVVAGSKVTVPTEIQVEDRYRTYWYMKAD